MATVNLRDYYPFYDFDTFIEINDDLAQQLKQWERDEQAYRRRCTRNHAYYSLNRSDGIENSVLFVVASSADHYEYKLKLEQLYQALAQLPEKQSRRIYAHYFMGVSMAGIARAEGLHHVTVQRSILRGLRSVEKFLRKNM